MKIEMILAQVNKHRHIKPAAPDAIEINGMR